MFILIGQVEDGLERMRRARDGEVRQDYCRGDIDVVHDVVASCPSAA